MASAPSPSSSAMTVTSSNSTMVVTSSQGNQTFKPSGEVLDEDSYEEGLRLIIERDFFPALPLLRAQSDYLQALEQNDLNRLKEITRSLAHRTLSTARGTPTPGRKGANANANANANAKEGDVVGGSSSTGDTEAPTLHTLDNQPVDTSLGLDAFQNKYISEDDASFEILVNKQSQEKRQKYQWLYNKETKQMALTNGTPSTHLIEDSSKQETWRYTSKNALMFDPDGAALHPNEIIKAAGNKPLINHNAVSFSSKPDFESQSPLLGKNDKRDAMWTTLDSEPIQLLRKLQEQERLQHMTPSANQPLPSDSPRVGGWSFVAATPSPMPGVDASPLMTWGELDSTPLLLDPSSTPSRNGPAFKLPEITSREKLATKLSEEASKKYRQKTKKALTAAKLHTPLRSPSSPFARERFLSPAASKLLKTQSGGFGLLPGTSDSQLRASYSSPSLKSRGGASLTASSPSLVARSRTPLPPAPLFPSASTMSIFTTSATPTAAATSTSTSTPATSKPQSVSLTDNLLDI